MFTAPFTSAFIVAPHDSQTYKPRSTRFVSRFRPQQEHVFDVSRSLVRSTRMPCSSALYSSRFVNRSNSHPWSFLFPRLPQFRESPFSSSRIWFKSPMTIRPTSWSMHRSTTCLARACRKWSFRRDNFFRARNARRDGPFSPSVSYSFRVK